MGGFLSTVHLFAADADDYSSDMSIFRLDRLERLTRLLEEAVGKANKQEPQAGFELSQPKPASCDM